MSRELKEMRENRGHICGKSILDRGNAHSGMGAFLEQSRTKASGAEVE